MISEPMALEMILEPVEAGMILEPMVVEMILKPMEAGMISDPTGVGTFLAYFAFLE